MTASAEHESRPLEQAGLPEPPLPQPLPEATECSGVSLHVSCRDFIKFSSGKLQTWLEKLSPVPMQKVFKLNNWSYSFVTVLPEHTATFREAVDGSTCQKHTITVKDGHPRGREHSGTEGEPSGKKRKVKEMPEGHIPTLKDLKEHARIRKGNADDGMLHKSAPLFEYSYEKQLIMKATYVKSAVRSITKQVRQRCEDYDQEPPAWTSPEWSKGLSAPVGCCCPLASPIGTPSTSLDGYRNKCEFTIGCTDKKETEVGFVLRILNNSDQLVASCADAPHVPAAMKRLCVVLRDLVTNSPFPIFDPRRGVKTGIWRMAMARLSPLGQMLVLVQTTTLSKDDHDRFTVQLVEALTTAGLGVVSIYLQFNDDVSDVARPDAPLHHLHGQPRLLMPLLGLNFEIGPLSFFQANSTTCEALYETAIDWLKPNDASLVLDVCCGVGTIGLCAARRCPRVVGIELVSEAVESARQNAALNGIENATFHVGKAEDVLPELLKELDSTQGQVCAIVDPPRPGLHHQITTALRRCAQLARIVYISCNPDSLVDDVIRLTMPQESSGEAFVPVRAVAVDMFPHTFHCEMVMLLERSSRVTDPRPTASEPAQPSN